MKGKLILELCVLMVFGIILVGCDNGSTDTDPIDITTNFEGIWIATSGNALNSQCRWEFIGNNFTMKMNAVNISKGTFTFTETEIKLMETHLWENNQWEDYTNIGSWEYNFSNTNVLELIKKSGDTSTGFSILGAYQHQ